MAASLHSKKRFNFEPEGVYVTLAGLQQLRFLAVPTAQATSLAGIQSNSGRHRSRAISRGMEFEEVRLYQAGDDIRSIDWRVTARTQVTHTKQYQDEKEKPVITLVDQRHSLFFGSQRCFKSVYACYLAALINWSTLKGGDRAGGLVIGTKKVHESRPARSHKNVNLWLQSLTEANNALQATNVDHSEPSFRKALKQLTQIAHSGTECALISDGYDIDSDCEKALFQLARRNQVHFFWLFDPLERQLPPLEQVAISDGSNKTVVSINKHSQEAFQQLHREKYERLQQLCQRLGIHFIEVDITRPLTSLIKSAVRGTIQ